MHEVSFRVETERELAEVVAKKVKQKVLRYVTWPGPYGRGDLDEVESKILGRGRRKARQEAGRKQLRENHGTLRLDARHGKHAPGYNKLAARVRKALALEQPVPVEELGTKLVLMGAHLGAPGSTVIWYPAKEWLGRMGIATPRHHIWSVYLHSIPNPAVETRFGKLTVSEVIHLVSGRLNCHPALALAFLLCELPVEQDEVTVVIHHPLTGEHEADPNITVYVSSADVPISVASYMYKVARLIVLMARRMIRHQSSVGTPRPRGVSEKVHALAISVEGTKQLSWQQRLSKWNQERPEWRYRSANSMRAVYYRAIARARSPKKKKEEGKVK